MTLSLTSATWHVAEHRNPCSFDDALFDHVQRLYALFDLPCDPEIIRAGRNIGFAELIERALGTSFETPPCDLVVLAYGAPDLHHVRLASAYANRLFGGACSFALSEQGNRAPFTALRIADLYARSGRCRDVALLVLEQTTHGVREPLGGTARLGDAAAVLFFGTTGTLDLRGVRLLEPDEPPSVPGRDVLCLIGAAVDPAALPTGVRVHRASTGSYCPGVWLELARHYQEWTKEHDTVVVYECDPRGGRHHTAVFGVPGTPVARSATP